MAEVRIQRSVSLTTEEIIDAIRDYLGKHEYANFQEREALNETSIRMKDFSGDDINVKNCFISLDPQTDQY